MPYRIRFGNGTIQSRYHPSSTTILPDICRSPPGTDRTPSIAYPRPCNGGHPYSPTETATRSVPQIRSGVNFSRILSANRLSVSGPFSLSGRFGVLFSVAALWFGLQKRLNLIMPSYFEKVNLLSTGSSPSSVRVITASWFAVSTKILYSVSRLPGSKSNSVVT